MKGSHRRLVVGLVFLLVVVVASGVLVAQAKAGTGVGFAMVKALADTGGSAAVPMMGGPAGAGSGKSCGAEGASCSGHEGSSCSMGKSAAKSAEEASASTSEAQADAAAASCSAEKGEDCSTCDEKDTCPAHEATEKAAEATTTAPDTK